MKEPTAPSMGHHVEYHAHTAAVPSTNPHFVSPAPTYNQQPMYASSPNQQQPTIVYYNPSAQYVTQPQPSPVYNQPYTGNATTYSKLAERTNSIMRMNGLMGLACVIISIIICSHIGSGPQIGSIVGGVGCLFCGFFASFCGVNTMMQIRVRGSILAVFSAIGFACAVATFRNYSTLQACATETNSFYGTFNYYGNSNYYADAYTCAAEDSFSWANCDCVNTYDSCYNFSLTTACNTILNTVPNLTKVLLVFGIMLITSCLGVVTAMFKQENNTPLQQSINNQSNNPMTSYPPPTNTVAHSPIYVAQPVVAVPVYN